jgi:hypothetical protein
LQIATANRNSYFGGMADPTKDELRTWLNGVLARTGETPSALARRAGLATTTLTRFLNDPDANMLGMRSVAKIAHVSGVEPIGLPRLPSGQSNVSGLSDVEGSPYLAEEFTTAVDRAVEALIAGRNATDPWVLKTRAIEAAGYLPGDIVIVDLNRAPKARDIVCAQDYRWADSAETIFRIYEPPFLVAACLDPALQEQLRRPLVVDNDCVVIKGVVTDLVRPGRR